MVVEVFGLILGGSGQRGGTMFVLIVADGLDNLSEMSIVATESILIEVVEDGRDVG